MFLDSKKIALVINTGGGNSEHRLNDAIALRRATLKKQSSVLHQHVYRSSMSRSY